MTAFHETAATGPCADRAAAMQALVPVIETPRLTLRAPQIGDFQDYCGIVLGPQGKFWGRPKTREDAWRDFMQMTGTWYLRGHGTWTITDKDTGAVLGFVLIGAEPGDEAPELGFVVAEEAEGKGLASEAARAVLEHGYGPMRLPHLVSYVDARNARSIALAERLGARREDRGSGPGEAHAVFWHPSPSDPSTSTGRSAK